MENAIYEPIELTEYYCLDCNSPHYFETGTDHSMECEVCEDGKLSLGKAKQ